MNLLEDLRRELPKRAVEIVVSAAGFLLALGINSCIEHRREEQTYHAMLKAVEAEASSNQAILADSYVKFFENGVVLKDFSIVVVSQSLASALFVKRLSQSDLELINRYERELTLSNSYRGAVQSLYFAAKPDTLWIHSVEKQWEPVVAALDKDTKLLVGLK
jgi:hypothetical protein